MKLEFCKPSLDAINPIAALVSIIEDKQHYYEPKGIWVDVLQNSFGIICDELGIAGDPRSVCLSFLKEFPGEDSTAAKTDSTKTDKFQITMALENPSRMMLSFCHEMIHVSDLVKGYLIRAEGKDEMTYKGKKLNPKIAMLSGMANLDAEIMPYERAAYSGQGPLMLKVLEKLPPEQTAWLEKTYKEDLKPPTLQAYIQSQVNDYAKKLNVMEQQFLKAKRDGDINPLFAQFNNINEIG